MIIARIHNKGGEAILAACDSDLMGRTLEEDDVVICLEEGFFGGHEVTEEEFRGMLAMATSANLVGENVVRIAVEEECVHSEAVSTVSGIPYAMFFCMG